MTNGYDALFRRTRLRVVAGTWNDTTTYGHDWASRMAGVTNNSFATAYQYLPGSSVVWQSVGWELGAPGGLAARLTTEPVRDALDRVGTLQHRLGAGPRHGPAQEWFHASIWTGNSTGAVGLGLTSKEIELGRTVADDWHHKRAVH